MKQRTFAVYFLFFIAVLAGLLAVYHALQYFGILAFRLFDGRIEFFAFNFFAGLMEALLAAIWFWAASMIWKLNPQGWLFAVVIAVINLVFAFVAVLGQTTFNELLPYILVNALALILGILPSTKKAFGVP